MLTLVLMVAGLLAGALLDDDAGWLLGIAAGAALGQALSAHGALRELRTRNAELSAELQKQGQLLQRVEAGMLWMWNDWQRARGQAAPSPSSDVAAVPVPAAAPSPPATVRMAQVGAAPNPAAASPVAPSPAAPSPVAFADVVPQPPQHPEFAPAAAQDPSPVARVHTQPAPGPSPTGRTAPMGAPAPAGNAYSGYAAASYSDGSAPSDAVSRAIKDFFFGGNTIARVGVLVLLVGVVLLLKWAADNNLFPIELRMALAALVGMALVGVGFRLRAGRPGFGTLLQGAGVAALYLTIFFSYRAYGFLPVTLAFGLLAAVSLASCVLAAVQDSMALIVVGTIGGFIAPILASSGHGNHVALFSYYLLLNSAVLGISVYKLWKPVALLGFVFTFGIGSTWGALKYVPENFASTEPFLLAFALIFAAIPVLMQWRAERLPAQPSKDGARFLSSSLTFGTPLVALALQTALLKEDSLQMAFALVGFAIAYVGTAAMLQKSAGPAFRPFVESFLAIGVGFATLAIPYAMSNRNLTGAAWALEGAGMYWIGVRQRRILPQVAAVVLQLLAGGALLWGMGEHVGDALAATSDKPATQHLIGAVLLMISSYTIGCIASRKRDELPNSWKAVQALLFWGLLLGSAILIQATSEQFDAKYQPGAELAVLGALCLLLELVSAALRYDVGRWPALSSFIAFPMSVLYLLMQTQPEPLSLAWGSSWPLLIGAMGLSARRFLTTTPWLPNLLAPAIWSLVAFAGLSALQLCQQAELGDTWQRAAFTLSISLSLIVLVATRRSRAWPFGTHRDVLLGSSALGLLLMGTGYLVISSSYDGQPAPLPFFPVLNPLDLAALLTLLANTVYLLRGYPKPEDSARRAWATLVACSAFIAFNTILARAVHHLDGTSYEFGALWEDPSMQWVLSGAWTCLAVGLMFTSSRRQWRSVWIAAAGLMGLTVVKLFLVDLSRQSTIAKIATFMAVGIALLVVGYVSPLPPRATGASPPPNPDANRAPEGSR